MTATATRGETTAERILDAAFKSIAAKGCGTVTLRGIADEAGVALSQLNYYYGNKDSLFAAVLKRMQQAYAIELEEKLRGCATLSGRIAALIDYNEFLLRSSVETYRCFLEFFNYAMNSVAFRSEVSSFLSDISAMIEAQITHDEPIYENASSYSAAAITRFILSASFGISLQHLLNPNEVEVQVGFEIIKSMSVTCAQEEHEAMRQG